MKGFTLPVLMSLVVPQIFPETLLGIVLQPEALGSLAILRHNISDGLAHNERMLLYSVYCQFYSDEFQDFVFVNRTVVWRNRILRDAILTFESIGGENMPEEEFRHSWETVLKKIFEKVKQHYDVSLFWAFNTLRQSANEPTRLEIVYSFCLAYGNCLRASVPKGDIQPLLKFWYQKSGGRSE
jgi:hypothetical protein